MCIIPKQAFQRRKMLRANALIAVRQPENGGELAKKAGWNAIIARWNWLKLHSNSIIVHGNVIIINCKAIIVHSNVIIVNSKYIIVQINAIKLLWKWIIVRWNWPKLRWKPPIGRGNCGRAAVGVLISQISEFKNKPAGDSCGFNSKNLPAAYAPLSPMASTGQPSLASLQRASSSGVVGCL